MLPSLLFEVEKLAYRKRKRKMVVDTVERVFMALSVCPPPPWYKVKYLI